MNRISFLSFFVSLVFLGCDGRPKRERFPGPQGRTTDVRQSQTEKAVLGGFDPMNNMLPGAGKSRPQEPANGPGVTPTQGGKIVGRIRLKKGLKLPNNYTLFIAARSLEGGPPLAVKRLENAKFPLNFELTEANAMIAGTSLTGEVQLSVRIDQDGNAMSRSSGDLSGNLMVEIGKQRAVEVEINEVVP